VSASAVEVERTWTEEHIARGRQLATQADRCPWELGDLALAAVPIGQSGVNSGAYKVLKCFAVEIGVESSTLRRQRDVANSWPGATRVAPATWDAHRALAGSPSDALHRKAILEELSNDDGRVTANKVRKYLAGQSPKKSRRDRALEVLDRQTRFVDDLRKIAADAEPLPESVRDRYRARAAELKEALDLMLRLAEGEV
jgi:hypothetical protein